MADEFVRKLAGFSLATACAFRTAANTSAAFSASGVSAAAGSSLGFSPGEGFAPAAGASTVAGTSTSNVLPPMATKAPMLPRTRSNGSGGGARLTSWLLPCSGLLPDPPAAAIAARVWSKSGPRPWAPSYHGVRDNQLPPRRPHREAFGLRYLPSVWTGANPGVARVAPVPIFSCRPLPFSAGPVHLHGRPGRSADGWATPPRAAAFAPLWRAESSSISGVLAAPPPRDPRSVRTYVRIFHTAVLFSAEKQFRS